MSRYSRARADFERLERIAELSDQVELDADRLTLMQNPTKETAARMYESGIFLWFREHKSRNFLERKTALAVKAIARRHQV